MNSSCGIQSVYVFPFDTYIQPVNDEAEQATDTPSSSSVESDEGSVGASGGNESNTLYMMSVIFSMMVCCLLLVIVGLWASRSSKSKADQIYLVHELPKAASLVPGQNGSPNVELSDAQSKELAVPIQAKPAIVADFSDVEGTKTTGNDDDIVDAIDNAVMKGSIGEDPHNDDMMLNDVNKLTAGNFNDEDGDVDVDEISEEQLRPIQNGGLASKSGSHHNQTEFI